MRTNGRPPIAGLLGFLALQAFPTGCGGTQPQAENPADGSAAFGSRIGVIDVARVLMETPEGKAVGKKLKQAEESMHAELEDRKADLEQLADEIRKMREDGADPETISSREQEFAELQSEAAQTAQAMQQQFEKGQAELLAPIMQQLGKVAGEVAQEKGFDLVLDRARVPFHIPTSDLTDSVIRKMGGEHSP